jgi:hypothetical protein
VNNKYPLTSIAHLAHWAITPATWVRFNAILNAGFDPQTAHNLVALYVQANPQSRVARFARQVLRETTPLRAFMPDRFTYPFVHENTLTNRLAATTLYDLSCFMTWIYYMGKYQPQAYPANCTPVLPDTGSGCRTSDGFLPDLAGRTNRYTLPKDTHSRLFGDIKPSYKFHSSWKTLALNPNDTSRTSEEFRRVIRQLQYYMRESSMGRCEREPNDHGVPAERVRYGYILTDNEVVLLKVMPRQQPGGRETILISQGFCLNDPIPQPPGRNWHLVGQHPHITGMFALVLIHLLASIDWRSNQGIPDIAEGYAM